MSPRLQKQLDNLIEAYEKLLTNTATQTEEVMYAPMAKHKWNMVQTLQHLNTAFSVSLTYLQYKLSQNSRFEYNPVAAYFRSALLDFSLNTNIRFKAPPQLAVPQQNVTLDAVQQEWKKLKTELTAVLNQLTEDQLRTNVFKHPVAGRMKAQHMLSFFLAHLKHHERQIKQYLARTSR